MDLCLHQIMKGNIYGLDLKLNPLVSKTPIMTIEINGAGYGTDFFKYDAGFSYYKKFAAVLGGQTGGKPLFIEASTNECQRDSLSIAVEKVYAQKIFEGKISWLEEVVLPLGHHFRIDTSWCGDEIEFTMGRIENPVYEPEEKFHLIAAREMGVPLYTFSRIEFGPEYIRFQLSDGRIKDVRPEDIGLIHSVSELYRAPKKYHHLFLSSILVEEVTSSKALCEFINRMARSKQYQSIPTFLFGLGLNEASEFGKMVEEYNHEFYVTKPSGNSRGIGVNILTKEQTLRAIEKFAGSPEEERISSIATVMGSIFFDYQLDHFLTLVQPFFPSLPLAHPGTGQYHDGCARVVVYSPPSGIPIVLGSQWRLAPHPLNGSNVSLEERLRANLSRGATATPIDWHHEKLLEEHAVGYIQQFETTLRDVRGWTTEYEQEIHTTKRSIGKQVRMGDGLRFVFWNALYGDPISNLTFEAAQQGLEKFPLEKLITGIQ